MTDASQDTHPLEYSSPALPERRGLSAWLRRGGHILRQTFIDVVRDDVWQLSAAVAFYAVLALAPLLLIALSAASAVWGAKAAQNEIARELSSIVGENIATGLQTMIERANQPDLRHPATVLGLIMLVVSGAAVFVQLQTSMNIIWNVRPLANSLWYFVRKRLMSLLMMAIVALLLLASIVASSALALFNEWLGRDVPMTALLFALLNYSVTFVLYVVLFATIFKIMPDADVSWRSALIGSAVTAILFMIGKHAIGIYLRYSTLASPYGAAGSLVLLLLWIYYSALIFYCGAEFTHALAAARGEEKIDVHAVREGPKHDRSPHSLPLPR